MGDVSGLRFTSVNKVRNRRSVHYTPTSDAYNQWEDVVADGDARWLDSPRHDQSHHWRLVMREYCEFYSRAREFQSCSESLIYDDESSFMIFPAVLQRA